MIRIRSLWALYASIYLCFTLSSIKIIDGSSYCGKQNHNGSDGELVPHLNTLTPSQSCNWHIFPEHHVMIESFLVFEEFELESNDECTVSEYGEQPLFPPFSGKKAIFTVLPGRLNLDVSVNIKENPSTDRKFKLRFSANECFYIIDKHTGHMVSPIYKDMNRPNVVICKFKFRDYKGLDLKYYVVFKEFHLTNSTLYVKDDKSQGKMYIGTDIPPNIAVSEGTIFELHLNTTIPGEKYSFDFSYARNYPTENSTTPHDGTTTITPTTPYINNDIASVCGRNEYLEENGTIILGDTERTDITFPCTWKINCEKISNAEEIYLSIEQFMLTNDDTLQILDSSGQLLFGPYNGEKPSFAILSGFLNLQIKVEINKNQKMKRQLKIVYNSKDCNNELTNEIGIVKLPLYQPSRVIKMATCKWTFNLLDKSAIEKVSFVKHKFSGHLSFEGNIQPKNVLENDVRFILAGENGIIKLNFDTHSETEFMFIYEKVDAECSSFIQLTDQAQILSSLQGNSFSFWNSCFWIIQSPENKVVIVDIQKLNLVNIEDSLTIIDGNNGEPPLLAQFNTDNQNKVKEKVIISRNNSLLVFFNTKFEKKSEFEAKLSIDSCHSFCDNGYCKLDEWECNGLDECSDGSDEKNCNGTFVRPTPKPKSESENKGTGISPVAIGLAVPGAFVIGILFPIAFAAGKQLYRNRCQSSYGQFPIYNDP